MKIAHAVIVVVGGVLLLGGLLQWNQNRKQQALEDCIQRHLGELVEQEKAFAKRLGGEGLKYAPYYDPCDPTVRLPGSKLCEMRRYEMERRCLGKPRFGGGP